VNTSEQFLSSFYQRPTIIFLLYTEHFVLSQPDFFCNMVDIECAVIDIKEKHFIEELVKENIKKLWEVFGCELAI
jgi:hypothetical protein